MKIQHKCSLVNVTHAVAILAAIVGWWKLADYGFDLAFANDDRLDLVGAVSILVGTVATFVVIHGLNKLRAYACKRLTSGTHN
jgi:hypothetical protein